MADFVFNRSKGHVGYYGSLPGTNDAIKWLLLNATGLEADATLKDYDTITALLAGASNELTDASYARQTATSVTVTYDDTNDRVDVDCTDVVWATLAGDAPGAAVSFYVPDTTAEADTTNIPLSKHDFAVTLPATPVTIQIPTLGFVRAS